MKSVFYALAISLIGNPAAAVTYYRTVIFDGGGVVQQTPFSLAPTYIEGGIGFAQFSYRSGYESSQIEVGGGVASIPEGQDVFWQLYEPDVVFASLPRRGKVRLFSFDVLTDGEMYHSGANVADHFYPTPNVWTTLYPTPPLNKNYQAGSILGDYLRNPSNPYVLDNFVFAIDVPEPTSWMLMIGGFGLAGMSARRRNVLRRPA